MIYTAAIDDSADRHRERVVISAAVIGDAERWRCLSKRWRQRLDEDGIDYFKSSHCQWLRGQFFKFRDEVKYPKPLGRQKADAVQADLDNIIRDCRLIVIGAVVPMDVYKSCQGDAKLCERVGPDPYHWAVQAVWGECALAMMRLGRNNIVSFAHDAGENFQKLHGLYEQYKQKNKRHARVMADFVQCDDKCHAPVQAADVAASVTFRFAEDWATSSNKDSLKRLGESMYKIVFWNEEAAHYAIALE